MKADATRRLLSMDLDDDDERAEWKSGEIERPWSGPRLRCRFLSCLPSRWCVIRGCCGQLWWAVGVVSGLDEASNRLAHLLISHGVGPGQRVALLLSRSVEAVVAIMGC